MNDLYKKKVIDPGDNASRMAKQICSQSFNNCGAITMVPHQPGNFRGPVGFVWKPHILREMLKTKIDPKSGLITSWTMLEEIQNDGAGGKPQFFTLVADPKIFYGLGWEIIAMTADDFARSGMLPAVIDNEINVKNVTEENTPALKALFEGYGSALKESNLANITGEIAIMNHSITAFCDTNSSEQLIVTWGASCIGLAHKDLLIDNSKIKPGMIIIGFLEDGYRCNGGTFFTNLIMAIFGPDIKNIVNNPEAIEFARKLTTPSTSYAKTICRIIGWKLDGNIGESLARIAGIAHVTGGGIWGKFGEILPPGVGAYLDSMPEPPEVLLQAQKMSMDIPELCLTDHQAYSTFHGGCGMIIVVEDEIDADVVIKEAAKDGIKAQIIGRTTRQILMSSSEKNIIIESRFKEGGSLIPIQ